MYTEVGEQMAEQNILNGNQKKLEQIIGDVKEHNTKKDRLEKLAESVKDISKELDNARKEKQNETDSKIKASTDAICAGYDKSIEADKEKIKTVSAERDKAKMAGVKERISAETASLRAQNEDLKDQINEAFIHENISKIYNSQLFISVFNPKQLLDYVIDIAVMVGLFVAVPIVLFLLPVIPQWILLIYCIAVSFICIVVVKAVFRKIVLKHSETIMAAQSTRTQIKDNNKRIIEDEKQSALEDFEKNTKADIISEINERYADKICNMETELEKKKVEYDELDDLVKKQRIYISSNYEAYLGKEFINVDKLSELNSIMKSDSADTIAQALAVYNNRH